MDAFFNAIVAGTAVLAIALTFKVIRMQRAANDDQTFLRLHEILMGDEMRRGRGLLIEAGKDGKIPEFGTAENRKMTHALGGLETAGIYIDQGLMSRDRFIRTWHHNLRAIRSGAQLMTTQRVEDLKGWWPWPHLSSLFDAADAFYDPKLICCQKSPPPPALD